MCKTACWCRPHRLPRCFDITMWCAQVQVTCCSQRQCEGSPGRCSGSASLAAAQRTADICHALGPRCSKTTKPQRTLSWTIHAMAQQNGDSSEPSSRAPVAFPDFRLFDSAQDILDHNKCAQGRAQGPLRAPPRTTLAPTRLCSLQAAYQGAEGQPRGADLGGAGPQLPAHPRAQHQHRGGAPGGDSAWLGRQTLAGLAGCTQPVLPSQHSSTMNHRCLWSCAPPPLCPQHARCLPLHGRR